jgi:hypothetical protein
MTLFLLYLRLKEHLMYSRGFALACTGSFAEAKPTRARLHRGKALDYPANGFANNRARATTKP